MTPKFITVFSACIYFISLTACSKDVQAEEPQSHQETSGGEAYLEEAGAQLQVGPWSMASWNIELPTVNYLNSVKAGWRSGDPLKGEPLLADDIDKNTGLPKRMRGRAVNSEYIFGTQQPLQGLAGDWVMEVDGEATVKPGLASHRVRINKYRFEWDRTADGRKSAGSYVSFSDIKGPLSSLAIFKKENEERFRAGKFWSQRFVDEVSKYHIVRSMDLQRTNDIFVTRADQIPPKEYTFWANDRDTTAPFQSLPHEALVALSTETGRPLWFQTPLHLGFPYAWTDPEVGEAQNNLRDQAKKHADEIIDSPEWDQYARDFVAALEKGDYPTDRLLYASTGNEVWNFAWPFAVNTNYAKGLGAGLLNKDDPVSFRDGYAAAFVRSILALDKALEEVGREQSIVFVLESHVANAFVTRRTIEAMKREFKRHGRDWEEFASYIGISVTSYWGAQNTFELFAPKAEWESRIQEQDPTLANDFADWIIDQPDPKILLTNAWVLDKWREHAKVAEQNGAFFLGAYEGGSHMKRPKWLDRDWYHQFHWGEEGGRVNKAVNDTLREAFPNAILSNYAIAGREGSSPWAEGEYGAQNPYALSWKSHQKQ